MRKDRVRAAVCMLAAGMILSSTNTTVWAARNKSALPSAGIDYTLGDNSSSLKDLQNEKKNETASSGKNGDASPEPFSPMPSMTATPKPGEKELEEEKKIEETREASLDKPLKEKEKELETKREEEGFKSLVIADVNDYVNIRNMPGEEGEILGKLYDHSVGTFLSEQDGWYEIQSGSVTGYVKAQYCVTGEEAVALAREVGTRIATVTTTTLKVREAAGMDATVLGLVPVDDQLLVTEELEGWVKVNIEEGDGFVSSEFVTLSTEFIQAESKEEEALRLAKEEADRKAAQAAAAAKVMAGRKQSEEQKPETPVVYASGGGSALGSEVANYACQFVGNPYVYGGSSLTSGTDCSGFVMSVYQNFGVSLPHSSSADRNAGTAVDGIENAQPGDIICYSGHVGIYIGNGQIVHASTSKTGIIISNATYRSILSVRRIF